MSRSFILFDSPIQFPKSLRRSTVVTEQLNVFPNEFFHIILLPFGNLPFEEFPIRLGKTPLLQTTHRLLLQTVFIKQEWNDANMGDAIFVHSRLLASAGNDHFFEEIAAFE